MVDVVKGNSKAAIKIDDAQYKGEDREIQLQYNPEKYSIGKTVTWNEQGKKGTTAELQFKKQGRKTLSFDLFFDTYEKGADVRGYTKKIVALTELTVESKPGKRRPPICLFSWGKLIFRGVVKSITQNFTLFSRNGVPVRARLTVSMEQFSTARDEAKGEPPGDPEKIRIVKEGDRLYSISAEEYGSPHLWRQIAEANTIMNPRILEPGQTLIMPALE